MNDYKLEEYKKDVDKILDQYRYQHYEIYTLLIKHQLYVLRYTNNYDPEIFCESCESKESNFLLRCKVPKTNIEIHKHICNSCISVFRVFINNNEEVHGYHDQTHHCFLINRYIVETMKNFFGDKQDDRTRERTKD